MLLIDSFLLNFPFAQYILKAQLKWFSIDDLLKLTIPYLSKRKSISEPKAIFWVYEELFSRDLSKLDFKVKNSFALTLSIRGIESSAVAHLLNPELNKALRSKHLDTQIRLSVLDALNKDINTHLSTSMFACVNPAAPNLSWFQCRLMVQCIGHIQFKICLLMAVNEDSSEQLSRTTLRLVSMIPHLSELQASSILDLLFTIDCNYGDPVVRKALTDCILKSDKKYVRNLFEFTTNLALDSGRNIIPSDFIIFQACVLKLDGKLLQPVIIKKIIPSLEKAPPTQVLAFKLLSECFFKLNEDQILALNIIQCLIANLDNPDVSICTSAVYMLGICFRRLSDITDLVDLFTEKFELFQQEDQAHALKIFKNSLPKLLASVEIEEPRSCNERYENNYYNAELSLEDESLHILITGLMKKFIGPAVNKKLILILLLCLCISNLRNETIQYDEKDRLIDSMKLVICATSSINNSLKWLQNAVWNAFSNCVAKLNNEEIYSKFVDYLDAECKKFADILSFRLDNHRLAYNDDYYATYRWLFKIFIFCILKLNFSAYRNIYINKITYMISHPNFLYLFFSNSDSDGLYEMFKDLIFSFEQEDFKSLIIPTVAEKIPNNRYVENQITSPSPKVLSTSCWVLVACFSRLTKEEIQALKFAERLISALEYCRSARNRPEEEFSACNALSIYISNIDPEGEEAKSIIAFISYNNFTQLHRPGALAVLLSWMNVTTIQERTEYAVMLVKKFCYVDLTEESEQSELVFSLSNALSYMITTDQLDDQFFDALKNLPHQPAWIRDLKKVVSQYYVSCVPLSIEKEKLKEMLGGGQTPTVFKLQGLLNSVGSDRELIYRKEIVGVLKRNTNKIEFFLRNKKDTQIMNDLADIGKLIRQNTLKQLAVSKTSGNETPSRTLGASL